MSSGRGGDAMGRTDPPRGVSEVPRRTMYSTLVIVNLKHRLPILVLSKLFVAHAVGTALNPSRRVQPVAARHI